MKRLRDFEFYHHDYEGIRLNELRLDSRLVRREDAFIAIKGFEHDGRDFIADAIKRGAAVVLFACESEQEHRDYQHLFTSSVPVIGVKNLSERLCAIAQSFYHYPAEHLRLCGITGTNGKTTIAQLLAQWYQLLGKKSASIGTLGNGLYGQLEKSDNTTPHALRVVHYLADFRDHGVDFCAMEVSSHALDQKRCQGLTFKSVIFTNLSRDHLDYHNSMEDYEKAKAKLFFDYDSEIKIINYDDEVGRKWLARLPNALAVSCDPQAVILQRFFVKAMKIKTSPQGTQIFVNTHKGSVILNSKLIGSFNISNLLLAFAELLMHGFDLSTLAQKSEQLTGVSGRMQLIGNDTKRAIIDYAHTPDALEKALIAARSYCQGELWCVFGCGGERDVGKRAMMGAVAERCADRIIITDDNPRTEASDRIVDDILSGMTHREKCEVIYIRQYAIERAMMAVGQADLVLIAGKGHEQYQIIGQKTFHFSDQEEVIKYLD